MIGEEYLTQDLCKKLVEKGMEINQVGDGCVSTGNLKVTILDDANRPYICTQTQAMRWLRDEKGVVINVEFSYDPDAEVQCCYLARIYRYNDGECLLNNTLFYKIYEQAAEAAIKYVIENLI